MQFLRATTAFVLCFSIVVVTALPNGAPSCEIGAANVREQHLTNDVKPETGTVEFGEYQTILAGTALLARTSDPTFSNIFQFGEENTLVIQSGGRSYIKGLLVIASGGQTNDVDSLDTRTPAALTITSTRTKEPDGCKTFNVTSVTHIDAAQKPKIQMNFKWPTIGQSLFIDVNIVKNNNITFGSQYYYSQYPVTSGRVTTSAPCGLLGLSIFCPLTLCGFFGRLFGLCNR